MTICPSCNQHYDVGEWPWCPHGQMATHKPFEQYWDTNVDAKPQFIDSHRTLDRLMTKNNLVPRDREHIHDLNHRRFQKGMAPLEE